MDILALLGSDNLAEVLKSTWYMVNEAQRSVSVWVHAARSNLLVLNPDKTQVGDNAFPSCAFLKSVPRDHIVPSLKAETKKVSTWEDGPHGKAWKRDMKNRPPRMMLEHLANTKRACENVFHR
jgi:hypothetical protein